MVCATGDLGTGTIAQTCRGCNDPEARAASTAKGKISSGPTVIETSKVPNSRFASGYPAILVLACLP